VVLLARFGTTTEMVAQTYIADSGGATRYPKKIYVSDSGGVSRFVKKIYVSDSGGITRFIFSGADYLSMVAGGVTGVAGYVRGTFGTLTPSVLGDGALVQELAAATATPHALTFTISGYAGVITSGYLISVLVGVSIFEATAATFTGGSSGGTAQWQWASGPLLSSGTTYPVTVQRSA
jgi:hypothetical protein